MASTHSKIKHASKQKRRKRAPNRKGRIRASRRWKKAQSKVSKLTRKSAKQRTDWAHKRTAEIVSCNRLVVTEKLTIKNMTRKPKKGSKRKRQKSGLNRSILDVGWGLLHKMLESKAAEANGTYLEAPTQKLRPSQRCPQCWNLQPKTLNERVHLCEVCHCTEDRDVASARVCLIWAKGLGTSLLDAESPSSTLETHFTGSLRQLGAKKRQKPLAHRSG
ncbi:MAG: transposase [Aphanocapsa sp. GSE-SYN-MK-11-07L]|jgi:IS605 OrfB family transposase|nr:transposase [Aphanocapsa sp. GSE-SYN-MK-11-07L]